MADYDPASHEKIFYRHAVTGDLGWLVKRDGKELVRLDRPNEVIEKRFDPTDWKPLHDHRPMTTMQAAMVAFEADKKLCFFLQDHRGARRDWGAMKDQQRLDWMKSGPNGHPARQMLFRSVMGALRSVAA